MREITKEIHDLCECPEKSPYSGSPWFEELLDVVQTLQLRQSDFTLLVDGWNIFLIRQRYRDDRQRETILLQLVAKPLSIILGLSGVKKPNEITSNFGLGIGLAEMVRRFWVDTQYGRVYLTDREIEQYNVDLATITQVKATPELRMALSSVREKSLLKMQKGFEILKESKAPRYIMRAMEQFQIWEELNMEKAQRLNYNPSTRPVELGRIKTYRLFWFQ